jgi:hypothetical protein
MKEWGNKILFVLFNFTSSVTLWTKLIGCKTQCQHRHLQSLAEVFEAGKLLENLKTLNIKDVYWTAQVW